ncbi:MAG: riboflavin biosynthesis protein RibF [Halofilum sp. (in: g-proteobacteria)]|nr:riboflavin biosynthesis protein RibF [Halofilum sp. (in: g-proteobacteria)]
MGARHVVVGDDFRFGRRRRGDFALLAAAGEARGFGVEQAATHRLDGERVSSTRVRAALAAGDLDAAARLLGGPYTIRGRVIHGERIGRRLGYPTANIPMDGFRLPTSGVFAVVACDAAGRRLPGVASLGWRPTVEGKRPLLEVHAFDFDGDLYGAHLAVALLARLRAEERFDSLDALVERMHVDAREARAHLAACGALDTNDPSAAQERRT